MKQDCLKYICITHREQLLNFFSVEQIITIPETIILKDNNLSLLSYSLKASLLWSLFSCSLKRKQIASFPLQHDPLKCREDLKG